MRPTSFKKKLSKKSKKLKRNMEVGYLITNTFQPLIMSHISIKMVIAL